MRARLTKYVRKISFLLLTLLLTAFESRAETLVRVVAYSFPPFLNEDLQTGLTPGLISLLNKSQDTFKFELVVRSPKRRYISLSKEKQDMILFEMAEWGWKKSGVTYVTTKEIMTGGEVYIARKREGMTQRYFDTIKDKRISAHFGYHYGFADFNADRFFLQKHFKIGLHHSHDRIIDLVLDNQPGRTTGSGQ